jgi:hypothetical protein
MKKIALIPAFILFISYACSNNNQPPLPQDPPALPEEHSADHSHLSVPIDAQSFMSEKFFVSDYKDGHFYLTVYYDKNGKRSFGTDIKFLLDDKNITKDIYTELKTRKQNDLQIWIDDYGHVNDILMMDAKKPGDSVRGALSLYVRGKYPIDARSSD